MTEPVFGGWDPQGKDPMLGKPTVATVPLNFTTRLAAASNQANRLYALSNARPLAVSIFTTLAGIKLVLVTKRTCVAFLTMRAFVSLVTF